MERKYIGFVRMASGLDEFLKERGFSKRRESIPSKIYESLDGSMRVIYFRSPGINDELPWESAPMHIVSRMSINFNSQSGIEDRVNDLIKSLATEYKIFIWDSTHGVFTEQLEDNLKYE